MANYQASFFENFPLDIVNFGTFDSQGRMMMHAVYVPGSLSFNNVNVVLAINGTTSKSISVSMGLYSLNGSTLSLANSASKSATGPANSTFFLSLATSAAQNITPGIWYLAYISSTSSNNQFSFLVNTTNNALVAANSYGGPFFRGYYSTTTNAFPASIATSNMIKEGTTANSGLYIYPYTIISA